MSEYTTGTKNSVENVATINPPMTALPNGAFCPPPSPNPDAMGSIPTTIAIAVINTGRNLINPALDAAGVGEAPTRCCSLAKFTMSMLLADPTPMLMIAPIRAGTLKVV